MPDEPITPIVEDSLGQPQAPKEVQVTSLNQPFLAPKPFTDFSTGDLVRLKSGGPVMTLGVVIPTHTLNTQVTCKWFVDGLAAEAWHSLGQLDKLNAHEAKLINDKDEEQRRLEKQIKERQHELAKIRAAQPQPPKK